MELLWGAGSGPDDDPLRNESRRDSTGTDCPAVGYHTYLKPKIATLQDVLQRQLEQWEVMSTEAASYGDIARDGDNNRATTRGRGSQQPVYRITPLNRLAFPKGKMPICELSGQPATVACTTPTITLYYATEEQAEQAWHGKDTSFSDASDVFESPVRT